jgi:hypothetical protein
MEAIVEICDFRVSLVLEKFLTDRAALATILS